MRLQHDLDGFINRQALDCSQERMNHKIHRVHIVVMQQHAIAREQTQQLFDILAGECIGLGTHELFLHRSKRGDQSSFSNYSNRPGYPCLAFWEMLAMASASQQSWRQRQHGVGAALSGAGYSTRPKPRARLEKRPAPRSQHLLSLAAQPAARQKLYLEPHAAPAQKDAPVCSNVPTKLNGTKSQPGRSLFPGLFLLVLPHLINGCCYNIRPRLGARMHCVDLEAAVFTCV